MTQRITTLANGLRVVSQDMPHLESASVGVWVDGGARYERPGEHGAAHLLEHMAFKGTSSRSAREIAEAIENVGGHLNAYTGREHTAYYARVLKDDLPLAVEILGDILLDSVFDETELARERDVVIQEIGQAEDTPDDIIFDHLQATAWPEQALGRPILGTIESVGGMTRDVLTGFMARHYRASRMVLVAAGAVCHEALVDLAEQHFRAVPDGAAPDYETGRWCGGEHRELRDLEQVHLALAFPGVAYADADFYAVQVMSTLLGGGMSSRLFQELRETRGLCYSVFSFASSYADGGMLGVYAGTGAGQVAELATAMCGELRRLARDGDETETARARTQLKAGLLMSLESSSGRVEQLARQMLIYGRPLELDEMVCAVEAVDAAAVRRVAERMLVGAVPTLAALGPADGLASYEAIAAEFA